MNLDVVLKQKPDKIKLDKTLIKHRMQGIMDFICLPLAIQLLC